MRLPGAPRSALIIGLPGSQALHDLETPALFAPHVLDLHGCLALRCQIQVLLSQVSSQLPDLKLEKERIKRIKVVVNERGRQEKLTEGNTPRARTSIDLTVSPNFSALLKVLNLTMHWKHD